MKKENIVRNLVIILILAVLGFAYYLYVADWRNPKSTFMPEQQVYVTATVDSTIERRKLESQDTTELVSPTMQLLVAKMDSDSVKVNLDRPLQEVVTIDMEEHKDPLFFTWEDIKTYYTLILEYFKKKDGK